MNFRNLLGISLLTTVCLFIFNISHAQHTELLPSTSIQQTTSSNNSLYQYRLRNGLDIIVKPDHRAPIVVSKICYKVGSAYEPNGITGISHVLEHMMFKGTHRYKAGEFSAIIASNGGQENAYTSRDQTCYFEKLTNDKLALSFKLEADRMIHLTLPKEEFVKEIEVVKEERRLRTENNPQALTYERFMAAAHIAHPYHHPIIGWMNDLNQLTIEDLRNWYRQYYKPNNAILIVVGDVEPRAVYNLAHRYFAHITSSKLPPLKNQIEPPLLGTRTVEVHVPAQLPYLFLGFNVPSLVSTDAEHHWEPYALDVLTGILDSGKSARLSTHLIREQGLATSISSEYNLYSKFSGLFVLGGSPTPEHSTQELQQALLKEIEQLQTQLVSEQELQRVKTYVMAHKIYAQDSMFYQAMLIGRLATVNLEPQLGDNYDQHIQAITAQQVQAVAQKYLIPQRLTIATLQPISAGKTEHAN
ncbi:MAG: pitrilysin family protein [Gammaproteobacteria bacterium]